MLSITAVGMHNSVLSLPADIPPSAVPCLCNVKTATRSPLLEELAASVLSIVRSCYVKRGRYQASHTFRGGVRCSGCRQIDRRVLYLAYVTSKPLRAGPPHGGRRGDGRRRLSLS
eukprot:4752736-Prymnesium_polylepis.1